MWISSFAVNWCVETCYSYKTSYVLKLICSTRKVSNLEWRIVLWGKNYQLTSTRITGKTFFCSWVTLDYFQASISIGHLRDTSWWILVFFWEGLPLNPTPVISGSTLKLKCDSFKFGINPFRRLPVWSNCEPLDTWETSGTRLTYQDDVLLSLGDGKYVSVWLSPSLATITATLVNTFFNKRYGSKNVPSAKSEFSGKFPLCFFASLQLLSRRANHKLAQCTLELSNSIW